MKPIINKEYTADELLEIIKEKGIVKAKTTEELFDIPQGTTLFFGKEERDNNYISSGLGCHPVWKKNRKKKRKFDINWSESWHSSYKGKFILLEILSDTQEKQNSTEGKQPMSENTSNAKFSIGEDKTPEIIVTQIKYLGRIYNLEE